MSDDTDRRIDAMDGVTLIINDHRIIEGLFDGYEAADDAEGRLGYAAKIAEELSLHATAEEHALYPAVRRTLPDGDEHEAHSLEEHQEARRFLAQLEATPVDDDGFDRDMRHLIERMRHHHAEEERDLLHPLRDALDDEGRQRLGRQIRRAKREAPVRPTADSGAGAATRDELYERAQALDVHGRSGMDAEELSEAIERGDE